MQGYCLPTVPKTTAAPPAPPSERRALRFWFWLGCIGFGGPAGQIAIMHQELVDRRRWLSETRFLRALSFCMALPGPEAQQLASYSGYTLYGVRGALASGGLFVLPGAVVMIVLSAIYVSHGDTTVVQGLVRGLSVAVVAAVAAALLRIGSRVIAGAGALVLAVAAFVASLIPVPFPLIIAAAAGIGIWIGSHRPAWLRHPVSAHATDGLPPVHREHTWRDFRLRIAVGLALWLVPVALLVAYGGTLGELAWFFSVAALVTFGGAYAVLPFVTHAAVSTFGWITTEQAIAGLALGETTPGPLILVNTFIGYVAGANAGGTGMALAGAVIATYCTVAPSLLFIILGAPLIDRIPETGRIADALLGVTVAVVGVIGALGVFVGRNVLISDGRPDPFPCLLAAAAFAALRWTKLGMLPVIAACALAGLIAELIS